MTKEEIRSRLDAAIEMARTDTIPQPFGAVVAKAYEDDVLNVHDGTAVLYLIAALLSQS